MLHLHQPRQTTAQTTPRSREARKLAGSVGRRASCGWCVTRGQFAKCRMSYTPTSRRQRALKVIAEAKRPGRSTGTQAVANALATLNSLDDQKTHAPEQHQKESWAWVESSHVATHHARIAGAGISLNGEIVAVTDPPSPSDHDENLGWREPTPDPQEQFNAAMRQTSETFATVVRWLATGATLDSIGLRAAALVSMVAPEAFENCSGSQWSIANRFGVTRAALQKYATQLRDLAPSFQSRNMRSDDVREASRLRAQIQHRKAGHRMSHA